MNLHQKLNAIMSEVTYIYKDGQISFGNTKYRAVTEENVLSLIRPKMVEHHVVMYPVEIHSQKEAQITSVEMVFKVVDADNPDDFILVVSGGQGSDTQDKGIGKAITYCQKYAILKLFLVPTGDDPDKVSSAEIDAKMEKQAVNRTLLNAQIMSLGGNDLERINSFMNRLFGTDGESFYDVSDEKATRLKLALAKAVKE